MWVFAVFGCLAALALVGAQVVRRREAKRRRAEAEALTRRPRPLTDEPAGGDVPPQRVVPRERRKQRTRHR